MNNGLVFYLSDSSEFADAFQQVPWTCEHSGSSVLKFERSFILLCVVIHFPSSCLCLLQFGEVGALVGENCVKKIIDYLSLLHLPGKQASHFLPERTHIFCSLFITHIPLEASLAAFVVPGQVLFYQGFSFLLHLVLNFLTINMNLLTLESNSSV